MTRGKWMLILLGIIDVILIIMHYTDYVLLFLKPTGYVIPLVINLVVIIVIIFRSKFQKRWKVVVTIAILFITIPILLFHGFVVLLQDNDYTKIDNPYKHQSLVIEYRSFTLGETTYSYDFYKTMFGLVGKRLDGESLSLMDRDYPYEIDAEGVLGLGNEEWITANTVRFFTWKGMKDVHVNDSQSSPETEDLTKSIEAFMKKDKKIANGDSIRVNGNRLTLRYDEASDQEWIEVANEEGKGAIPTQQCTRIVPNEEQAYYMLEECTHQWEYPLYPMK